MRASTSACSRRRSHFLLVTANTFPMMARLIVVAMLCSVTVLGQQSQEPPAQPEQRDEDSDTVQGVAEPPTTIINQTVQAIDQTLTRDDQNEPPGTPGKLLEKALDPLVWITLALAIVAVVQARIYCAMHNTTRTVERAYIYVEAVTQYRNFEPGETPSLMVTVINSGTTPGRIVEARIATIPVLTVENDLPKIMPDPGMRPTNLVVVKGQRMDWGNQLAPVPQEDFERVFKHNFKLVVFGRIGYRDAFNAVHHTDFSFVYNPKQWKPGHIEFVIDPNGYSDAN